MSKNPFSRRRPSAPAQTVELAPVGAAGASVDDKSLDLRRRRDQLSARLAELQWDLGGLAYEMAVRHNIRADVITQRAAVLQDVDAELSEVERILRMEESGIAGSCGICRAPHSSGAVFCWQCGAGLLPQVEPTAAA